MRATFIKSFANELYCFGFLQVICLSLFCKFFNSILAVGQIDLQIEKLQILFSFLFSFFLFFSSTFPKKEKLDLAYFINAFCSSANICSPVKLSCLFIFLAEKCKYICCFTIKTVSSFSSMLLLSSLISTCSLKFL